MSVFATKTIPHASLLRYQELAKGTLKNILSDSGISVEELISSL